MIHLLTYGLGLLLAGWCVWLPGWCLERRIRVGERSDRFFARWILGFGFWTAILLLLATTGLFDDTSLVVIITSWVLLWHGVAVLELRRSEGSSSQRESSPRHRPDLVNGLISTGLAVVILGPLFCITVNPTVSWDSSVYHLTLPKLYIESGGFRPVEMSVYSHWPHAVELFFGAAMAFGGYVLAKSFHFGFGLLVLASFRRLLPSSAALLAMALFVLNGVVIFEMKVAYVDLAHAFFLLAACALASTAADARHDLHLSAAFLAGLAAALLTGVKVTGIVSAAIVALILLPRWLKDFASLGRRQAARSILAFALPIGALWLPWLIKSWIFTGNPVYPWAWSLLGGPDWSLELAHQLNDWQRGIGMGRSMLDSLLLPFRVILMGGEGYDHFDGEIAPFWLLAIPAALWAAKRGGLGSRLVLASGLHALWWATTSQQMRFLIPTLALLAVAAAFTGNELCNRWLAPKPGRLKLVSVVLAFAIVTWAWTSHSRVMTSGWRHFQIYTRPGFEPLAETPREAIFEDVENLPENAKLLFLNTNRGFFCSREYLADSFFEASQISDWLKPASDVAEVHEMLRRRGISHILLDRSPLGVPYPPTLLALLNDPLIVKITAQRGRFLLLALRSPELQETVSPKSSSRGR